MKLLILRANSCQGKVVKCIGHASTRSSERTKRISNRQPWQCCNVKCQLDKEIRWRWTLFGLEFSKHVTTGNDQERLDDLLGTDTTTSTTFKKNLVTIPTTVTQNSNVYIYISMHMNVCVREAYAYKHNASRRGLSPPAHTVYKCSSSLEFFWNMSI